MEERLCVCVCVCLQVSPPSLRIVKSEITCTVRYCLYIAVHYKTSCNNIHLFFNLFILCRFVGAGVYPSVSGHKHTHKHSHLWLIYSVQFTCCMFMDCGGNWSTQRKPTQTRGEHVRKASKRGPFCCKDSASHSMQ